MNNRNNVLIALNGLSVIDWSCAFGECEYILVENSEENRNKLKSVGITEQELEEYEDKGSESIDISFFGFSNGRARYWSKESGFMRYETPLTEDL